MNEDKNCKDCVFYSRDECNSYGVCEYPVPSWLGLGCISDGAHHNVLANCSKTYKNRVELAHQEIKSKQ